MRLVLLTPPSRVCLGRLLAGYNLEVILLRLYRLGRLEWEVLAISDADGNCQVTDFLVECAEGHLQGPARAMLNMLRERLPAHGTTNLTTDLIDSVGDGIWELRKRPSHGAQLRVLFFYDANRIIVCTNAFSKKRKSSLEAPRKRAISLKKIYLQAKEKGEIQIDDYTE